jgi:hypothetical protein
MAHHPQAILDVMAGMEGAVARAKVQQRLLQYLPYALLFISIAGFFVTATGKLEYEWLPILFFVMFGMGMLLLVVFRGRQVPQLREHFDIARHILHTLRDDTGRKGRVVGWLDLGGPQQKEKTVRTARSGGGKRKVYYRDPWLRVKFKLADGNLLRLTLEDKVKVKAGSIVRHQSQLSAKLVVNPDLYRPVIVPANAIPVTNATLVCEPDVLVVKAAGPAKDLSAQQVLQTLRAVYSHLEPIGSKPVGSQLPPADTAEAREV